MIGSDSEILENPNVKSNKQKSKDGNNDEVSPSKQPSIVRSIYTTKCSNCNREHNFNMHFMAFDYSYPSECVDSVFTHAYDALRRNGLMPENDNFVILLNGNLDHGTPDDKIKLWVHHVENDKKHRFRVPDLKFTYSDD